MAWQGEHHSSQSAGRSVGLVTAASHAQLSQVQLMPPGRFCFHHSRHAAAAAKSARAGGVTILLRKG